MTPPTFLLPEPVAVEGLGFTTADATWCGEPLLDRQRAEVLRAGLVLGDSDDVVTLSPGSIATAAALRAFVVATDAEPSARLGVLADPVGAWADHAAFGAPARMIRWRGRDRSPDRLVGISPIAVPVTGTKALEVRLADVPGGRAESLPHAPALLVPVGGWAGLLWANLLTLPDALETGLREPAWSLGARALAAWWRGGSGEGFLARFNRVDEGAFVHPDASVTASWIKKGARVGPGAVVSYSIIGEGASVEAGALAQYCVLAPRAHVQRRGFAQYAVVSTDAAVAGTVQLAVLGPGSAVKRGATLLDQTLDGAPVRVLLGGQLHPVPLGSIGVGVGARTVVGHSVVVMPGRSLPADLRIAAGPGNLLVRVPEGASGLQLVHDGTLVPR